ncbi:hypothetical protein AMELA_G00040910 [Ameiurus melas]|uniref:Uncharacterized protein n=1 Tax=Ameiurus melas TaxID=219545 RepID=A0A7J6B9K0_AMEME|nr:hypothetical protein AMELA_G00040910 [Ameiurus melas]
MGLVALTKLAAVVQVRRRPQRDLVRCERTRDRSFSEDIYNGFVTEESLGASRTFHTQTGFGEEESNPTATLRHYAKVNALHHSSPGAASPVLLKRTFSLTDTDSAWIQAGELSRSIRWSFRESFPVELLHLL